MEPRRARVVPTVSRALLPIAVTAAVLLVLPTLWFEDSPYTTGLAVEAVVFGCYAVGFNLIFGSTNQLFLCVGALAGVGGYATAILSDRWSLPLAAGVALGTVIAGIVGGVLAWVAVRRSLDVIFTGVVTLVFSLAFTQLLIGQSDLTGGDTGQVLEGAATNLADDAVGGYYLFVGLLVALLVVFRVLQLSHIGWAFRALRDDETAAQLAGVDVARYRVYAAVVGSAMIGLTGGLYAYSLGFISPVTYEFSQVDVQVLVIVAFGGLGTLLGPVVGAAAFGFLDRALTDSGQLREAYYGAFVIVIFVFLRQGVIPLLMSLARRLGRVRRKEVEWEPSP
ncbi:MAG TPA: branched-chain amino acid ABC transporter permease [Gaiella sp.]|nr:branched-chain amino acid ABC transporter permease [Gaiella sp.]